MHKVYIVIQTAAYEDSYIIKVFANKDDAAQCALEHGQENKYYDYYVDEYTVQ